MIFARADFQPETNPILPLVPGFSPVGS
jgi:hypothetical protein